MIDRFLGHTEEEIRKEYEGQRTCLDCSYFIPSKNMNLYYPFCTNVNAGLKYIETEQSCKLCKEND